MNLLLYPTAVKFKRRHKLPAKQFQYLEGCVRQGDALQGAAHSRRINEQAAASM